jgi:hypothetical protein
MSLFSLISNTLCLYCSSVLIMSVIIFPWWFGTVCWYEGSFRFGMLCWFEGSLRFGTYIWLLDEGIWGITGGTNSFDFWKVIWSFNVG